jgi:hypothetical protein
MIAVTPVKRADPERRRQADATASGDERNIMDERHKPIWHQLLPTIKDVGLVVLGGFIACSAFWFREHRRWREWDRRWRLFET